MKKILVVDDEKNIRQGIKAMIENKYPNVYEILLASNGQEALNYYKENNIDILITDIRMPVMDGLTLISNLHNNNIETNIIILSGYDDFNYATHALRNGAKDYLLKPIKRNQLYDAIDRIEKETRNKENSFNKTNKNADEFFNSQVNYILLNSNLRKDDVNELCKKINLDVFKDKYYIYVIDKVKCNNCQIDTKEVLKKLKEMLSEYKRGLNEEFAVFLDKDGRAVVICNNIELHRYIILKFEQCHITINLGISEESSYLGEFRDKYYEAIESLKYIFLYANQQVIRYSDIKNRMDNYIIPINKIKKLNNMIGTDREEDIKSCLREIFDINEILKYKISYIEEVNKEISGIIKSFITNLDRDFYEEFKEYKMIEDIYSYLSFHEYYRTLENLILKLNEYINQKKLAYTDNIYIEKAIKYIHENYYKDINMAMVSNYVSLNYSYFSQIFKEYIGLNFVDYLKKIRIEEAKKLLEDNDYKIYEVGEKVGYKNSKQFAKIFKEMEGISPIEYRQKVYALKFK
ncbi:response regulator [Caloramator sp. ALD01]|uniref:response regulator transcription factor n=1 Tax=Caloramator sp. ALD01 TaxID=1031288 RepID=UPI0003F8F47C|nr:response regulator [Caloramator sp. ALD01]